MTRPTAPIISDAPGLKWRFFKHNWQARWVARHDIRQSGYPLSVVRLWDGRYDEFPTEADCEFIQNECRYQQNEMLKWSHGSNEKREYDHTIKSLVWHYKNDPVSRYRKLRHHTRTNYNSLLAIIERDMGATNIKDLKARDVHLLHEQWSRDGERIPIAHSLIGMLRTICKYGVAYQECEFCIRLSTILGALRFEMGKPRSSVLTAEQATAIRQRAHERKQPSIALAQAFQFECTLRQKDVLGEWVPLSEPGPITDTINGGEKWMRGIRWEEIDASMVLHHITSKRQKLVEPDLKNAPMVIEELTRMGFDGTRASLPPSGPIVRKEGTDLPWSAPWFRVQWREIATDLGIPKNVRNMDSRAGAITEALQSGARPDSVRKAATHSDMQMTSKYSRADAQETAEVMRLRAASRNKSGT